MRHWLRALLLGFVNLLGIITDHHRMLRRAVHRQAPLDRTLSVVAAPWFERRRGKSSQTLRRWPHAVERRAVKRKAFGCKAQLGLPSRPTWPPQSAEPIEHIRLL